MIWIFVYCERERERERERETALGSEGKSVKERKHQAASPLSTGLHTGSISWPEIMTRAEIKNPMLTWLSHPGGPLFEFILPAPGQLNFFLALLPTLPQCQGWDHCSKFTQRSKCRGREKHSVCVALIWHWEELLEKTFGIIGGIKCHYKHQAD